MLVLEPSLPGGALKTSRKGCGDYQLVIRGVAAHAGIDTKNCVIVAEPGKLISTIGVSDLLIVQDGDAILIAHRKDEGTVRKMVDLLKARRLEKYL